MDENNKENNLNIPGLVKKGREIIEEARQNQSSLKYPRSNTPDSLRDYWGYIPYSNFQSPTSSTTGAVVTAIPFSNSIFPTYPMIPPQRSAFEEVIDILFSTAEKEQYLIDIGYEFFVNSSNGRDEIRKGNTAWDRSLDLNMLFLKEISIKFKNLLLAKPSLKIKI